MDSVQNKMEEQQVQKQKDKRFNINDSVWIAAAAMTYEIYYKKRNTGQPIYVPDFILVQSDIRHRTLVINGRGAPAARTSRECCGDHESHTYCFLRAIGSKRRLSFPGEFGGKEEPERLEMSEVISTDIGDITIQQLHDFVHKEYAALEEQIIKKTNIDYKAPLDYIDKHSKEEYAGPNKPVPPEQRAKMDELRECAQNAVGQIQKMMALCEKRFNLKRYRVVKWLDGSNEKTKHYLWGQMKYADRMESPISLSIFVDKNAETLRPRYRISLEIMNKGVNKELMTRYHSYLDLDPDEEHELIYGDGSDEKGYVKILNGGRNTIKAKIEDGSYEKVQYCKVIDQNDTYSNEDYEQLILEGVKVLIPYYEYVIGKKTEQKAAWLLTWNPVKWEWQHFPVWCKETKAGNVRKEEWTCSSKKPALGDDVFLMKTGDQPRGIIAHGTVSREYFEAPHYNPERAAEGVMSGCIEAVFDRILNYEEEDFILQEDLKTDLPEQTWSPMSSGIEIKKEVLPELLLRWYELIGTSVEDEVEMKKFGLNTILYGPPGTGKTYNTVKYAVAICEKKALSDYDDVPYVDLLEKYEDLRAAGRIEFTTFHQSYGYEEFIEGIKPVLVSDVAENESKDIQYDVIPGLFKTFCQNATTKKEDEEKKPYVFIIDEINRGNISKIFGELITLIEETKRSGAEEAMEIKLPYSGNFFSVPDNVYILGTMNTADRSIALMDTALRRRFDFEEMMPDSSVIDSVIIQDGGESIDVAKMLDIINERITFLYDREHTIGHAFFTKLIKNPSLAMLADIFRSKIVPLLQEYFYEDYAKIQLVLGDNDKSDPMYKFILDKPVKVKSIFKGTPEDIVDLPEKNYVIQDEAFEYIQSYIEIE